MTSLELAKKAAAFLDNKKAERVHVIEIENISSLADYFVIATGNNNTHVRALADELEEKLKGEGLPPARVEGYRSNSWILLDWGNVVIHIFTQEGRDFYDLDHLWADGKNVEGSPCSEGAGRLLAFPKAGTAFAKVAAGIFPGGPRRNGATGKQDGSRERSDSP